MTTPWLISYVALWVIVLGLAFLLLGALRSLGLLQWRLDELEATRPVRKGRDGLPAGNPAPDFRLPSATNGYVSLSDFAGRKVLLIFTQSGCGPCHGIMPELNRLQAKGEYQVVVVNHGLPEDAAEMATEIPACFPIVTQDDWSLSKAYQVFATPYAFVIDEQGVIAAKGVASSPQYLSYIFDAAKQRSAKSHVGSERDSTVERESVFSPDSREVTHV